MDEPREITVEELEARCVELVDEVADTGAILVVTKDGDPVARIVPAGMTAYVGVGFKQLVSNDELIEPLFDERKPDWPES